MESTDIIIIGAGAAGMMAAYELTRSGRKVTVLEARDRIGGRIHTIEDSSFKTPLEAGAEFIHGNLSLTFKLIKEARLPYYRSGGRTWVLKDGELRQGEDLIENWHVLMSRINKVKKDLPLSEFLLTHLPEPEYEQLRKSVTSLVEGYDAADATRTSTLAMKEEWSNEDQWEQYRVRGGYLQLIQYLANEAKEAGARLYLSSVVKQVQWKKHDVTVITAGGNVYHGKKVILTVPLGVLQAGAGEIASISFSPSVADKLAAAKQMGYGAVTKVLLEFDHAFWQQLMDNDGNSMQELGFLFSEEAVPTWWTQFPEPSSMLTGWLAGPDARALKTSSDETILEDALNALRRIFSKDKDLMKSKLTAWRVFNWTADPFTLGAYAFNTLASADCKKIIKQPVDETLYFSGEALAEGNDCATVEAALASGKAVAEEIAVHLPPSHDSSKG